MNDQVSEQMNEQIQGGAVTLSLSADHIALVTINRPQARNAVNEAVALGLEHAIHHCESVSDVWVVVLTGAGTQAFCAGADLKEVSAGRMLSLLTANGGFAGFVHAKRSKPWIAAVNGPAVAGGFEIALACDLIVAASDATFGLPEVKRGLIAAAGGLYRLPRALPRQLASELIATGETLSATRAYELGIVNRVVEKGAAVAAAVALATTIARNAPIAVRESLGVVRRALDLTDEQLCAASYEAQDRIMKTEDFKEGPLAFIEKRAPRWVGR